MRRVAAELAAQGSQALALVADVADEQSLAEAIERAEAHFGRIDVMFNNAGIGGLDVTAVEMSSQQWDQMLAINLAGRFLSCKYGVPALMRAGGGAIVN